MFIASNSKASFPCMQFVSKNKIPIQIVRLDTEQAREAAANGKFFQITSVPTMAVFYEDGNVQLFAGSQKIIQWLTAMMKAKSSAPREDHRPPPREETNMYGPSNGGARRSLVSPVRKHTVDEGHDLDDTPRTRPVQRKAPQYIPEDDAPPEVVIEEDLVEENEIEQEEEPEPAPVRRSRPKPKSKKLPKSEDKPKRKPRAKKVVEQEEDDLEFLDDETDPRKIAREKLNAVASEKSKPKPSRMKNLYNLAKQMEQDRDSSLGYKEEDLPRF